MRKNPGYISVENNNVILRDVSNERVEGGITLGLIKRNGKNEIVFRTNSQDNGVYLWLVADTLPNGFLK